MKAHCLFEQSGTFKNEFKKLGIEAYDYDILNDFGETDYQIDIFSEIVGGYNGKKSIFDTFSQEDIIMCFFPCTRFEQQILLWFRGESKQQSKNTDTEKLEMDIKLHEELSHNYKLITMLSIVILKKGLKMIFENPFSQQHYLTKYWCLKPSVIDLNRRENGDYFEKPTQYWFIGFEPKNNMVFEPLQYVEKIKINNLWGTNPSDVALRSKIHPQYAERFIKKYIIDYETDIDKLMKGE